MVSYYLKAKRSEQLTYLQCLTRMPVLDSWAFIEDRTRCKKISLPKQNKICVNGDSNSGPADCDQWWQRQILPLNHSRLLANFNNS